MREIPLDAPFSAWSYARASDRLLLSLADGSLLCVKPDGERLWKKTYASPCRAAMSRDGKTIVAGTTSGSLLWLDADGEVTREVDLMEHNLVGDLSEYAATYTQNPGGMPLKAPTTKAPDPIDVHCGGTVQFSENLLRGQPALEALTRAPFAGQASFAVEQTQGNTYVLSLFQRSDSGGAIKVSVAGGRKAVYSAELPVSRLREERTMAWRAASEGKATLSVKYDGKDQAAVELDRVVVCALTYPSRNILLQSKTGNKGTPVESLLDEEDDDDLAGLGMGVTPPKITYLLPNDLEIKSWLRKPFKALVWPDLPFDAALRQDKTSWLTKPIAGKCSYATLTLEFEKPVELAAFAVYEDAQSASRYTDTYAVFIHDTIAKRWVKAGHVIGNRSPFNLFTFSPIQADKLVYEWLKSADGHARVAEFEGYASEGTLLP